MKMGKEGQAYFIEKVNRLKDEDSEEEDVPSHYF